MLKLRHVHINIICRTRRNVKRNLKALDMNAGWMRCRFEPIGGGLLVSLIDFSGVVGKGLFSLSSYDVHEF